MTTGELHDTVVAIANGEYAELAPLTTAVQETAELVALLRDEHGFESALLADRRRGDLLNQIDVELAPNALPGVSLVLLWTGHAIVGPDYRLRLMARTDDDQDGEVATAGQLGEWATRTGAKQVLVVLDTCYSGHGVPDAYATAAAVLNGRADPGAAWFGVVAASRGDEPARSGAMARALKRLFTDGPADDELRQRWNPFSATIRGDDLVDALVKEWHEPRQTPVPLSAGNPRAMLRNPLHHRRSEQIVVEHLRAAARGTSTAEDYFTGRDDVLAGIVDWMRSRRPGLYLITGPPGSGKSAVVGRIVSLSIPEERQRLNLDRLTPDTDPGHSIVDVHLHARGLTSKAAIRAITARIGLGADSGIYDLLAHAARQRELGRPMVVVIDGLDEAGEGNGRDIAVQVVEPLAREALVLVGTREVPGPVGEPGLLGLLGTCVGTVDLGTNVDETLRDVHGYVVRRLRGIATEMDPQRVADELVSLARAADPALDGPFLLARLVTSKLRVVTVDTSEPRWRDRLASSVEKALEDDLQSTVLSVGGQQHPTAARELLHALAYAHGSGMPVDDVWPEIATALSPSGTAYSRDDCYALLQVLGRHVVTGSLGDQAVYRVAHQRLVDHLRQTSRADTRGGLAPTLAQPIADVVARLYETLLEDGQRPQEHDYLWFYAWRHFADAGEAGIALMRRFVERDRQAFLLDLAECLDAVVSLKFLSADSQETVKQTEELVALRRELGDPIDLATALFELAAALMTLGDPDAADEAAVEAVHIARDARRDAQDDPVARSVLGAGLNTQALAQLRQGNSDAAQQLALEAVSLFETGAEQDSASRGALATALTTAARAALLTNDIAAADTRSKRASDLVGGLLDREQMNEAVTLETYQVRALVELVQVSRAAAAGGSDLPRASAAAEIVRRYRQVGGTGTVSDVSLAEGLRLLAITTQIRTRVVGPDPLGPDPLELLNEATELVAGIADRHLDGTLTLVSCLSARAALLLTSDSARAAADLDEAERRLRSTVPSTPVVAALLAEAMTLSVSMSMATGDIDLSSLIDRAYEAVDLYDVDGYPISRESMVSALNNLVHLLAKAGRTDEAAAAQEAVVGQLRELLDGTPRRALVFAGALADLCNVINLGRPIEAIELANEALEVLQPFGAAIDGIDVVRGLCETNLSVACQALDRSREAEDHARRAIELFDSAPESPVAALGLIAALNNKALVELAAGKNDDALKQMRRAVGLLGEAEGLMAAWLPSQLRITLGRALQACGLDLEAAEAFSAGVVDLRSELASGSQLVSSQDLLARLAYALNAAGPSAWETVLEDLRASPELALRLALHRTRADDELPLTIATIVEGLDVSGDDASFARVVHEIARMRRAVDTERFDAMWAESVGEIPEWLSIDPALSNLLVAWWNADSLRRSRSYLLANPRLLDEHTDLLIDELTAEGGVDEKGELLRQLRSDAAARGIEAAYAPLFAEELIDELLDADDTESFLADHLDELLAPEVHDALTRDQDDNVPEAEVILAILALARSDESAVAFSILEDPEHGVTLLRPAWRSADPERLIALARLCLHNEAISESASAMATVAISIGKDIQGHHDEAQQLAESALAGVDDELRGDLLGAVADALAYQPEQGTLLDLLRTMQAGAGQD